MLCNALFIANANFARLVSRAVIVKWSVLYLMTYFLGPVLTIESAV